MPRFFLPAVLLVMLAGVGQTQAGFFHRPTTRGYVTLSFTDVVWKAVPKVGGGYEWKEDFFATSLPQAVSHAFFYHVLNGEHQLPCGFMPEADAFCICPYGVNPNDKMARPLDPQGVCPQPACTAPAKCAQPCSPSPDRPRLFGRLRCR